MAKSKEVWRCSVCGAQTLQWLGQCPSCSEWNTLQAVVAPRSSSPAPKTQGQSPLALASVPSDELPAFSSGISALDRILGRGLVPGASLLIGGEPGIGKSTLLLQLCGNVARQGKTVLYASGEEGLVQIRGRGERLGALYPSLLAMATSRIEEVIAALETSRPQLLVLDSVQTMTSVAAEGLPGNVSQVRAVASEIVEVCRRSGTTLMLVGHVTKDGILAGPRILEHMVDTVIAIEGDRRQMFRLLRVYKNRFGPNEELLIFEMRNEGLLVVPDPSTYFLEARDASLSGAALAMTIDGKRPLVVEVQALAARSYLSIPRRTALGFDVNRLNLLLAVLEKRLKLSFGQMDIYAKVGGGIKIQDPGLDLAVVTAVLSSMYDAPLPEKSMFWGEVDLNGQVRHVGGHSQRLAQATRLGFSPLFFPASQEQKKGISTVQQLQGHLFGKSGKK